MLRSEVSKERNPPPCGLFCNFELRIFAAHYEMFFGWNLSPLVTDDLLITIEAQPVFCLARYCVNRQRQSVRRQAADFPRYWPGGKRLVECGCANFQHRSDSKDYRNQRNKAQHAQTKPAEKCEHDS